MDMRRIRPADEDYWQRHRARRRPSSPWPGASNSGAALRATDVGEDRDTGSDGGTAAAGAPALPLAAFAGALRSRLSAETAGFTITPVRARGSPLRRAHRLRRVLRLLQLLPDRGAVLLAGLFFRLGVEQRVREIGTLRPWDSRLPRSAGCF